MLYFALAFVLQIRYNDSNGIVAQLVRALPCHGRGREFESRRFRHFSISHRGVAQLVAHTVWDREVAGSSPVAPTTVYIDVILVNLTPVKWAIFVNAPEREFLNNSCSICLLPSPITYIQLYGFMSIILAVIDLVDFCAARRCVL